MSQKLKLERQKIAAYEEITGAQASSIEDLYKIAEIRETQRQEMEFKISTLSSELKKANRGRVAWKIGTFVLVPSALIGGIIIGVKASQ